jgi:hypothetical protein
VSLSVRPTGHPPSLHCWFNRSQAAEWRRRDEPERGAFRHHKGMGEFVLPGSCAIDRASDRGRLGQRGQCRASQRRQDEEIDASVVLRDWAAPTR